MPFSFFRKKYVFLSVLPLHCFMQAFSSCGEGGLLSCCGARASHWFATPWTAACQAPLSMEFSIQEYWSGLPFPSPADLPNPGMEPGSPTLQADFFLQSEPAGKPFLLLQSTGTRACGLLVVVAHVLNS